ncbi:MAG: DUF2088 domain-containing protein, partial [Planctomycetes bacterium]|nr:DUF2088 domain-containing protein [Planctomycetota bacterium]
AGSRGITNIGVILRSLVEHLTGLGTRPFIVPAMGSHAGATAQGQQEFLESYGITERLVGCPIRSTMETAVVCQTAEGFPVHFDRFAYEADHVVVVNRVKPHTRFVGEIESGLLKMMLIGLGKCEGATVYHRAILDYSFAQIIRSVVGEVLRNCKILAGLAILENAHEETALIEAVLPQEFESREKELLKLAQQWMARLPFRHADVLLIDQIGKNISGSGMDTNVVGRRFNDHAAVEDEFPKVKVIALRGLTPQTHGNAIGMGLAEFCKTQMLRETDFEITRLNTIISTHLTAAMQPLDYETDREILDIALGAVGLVERPEAKIVWIRNTLELAEMECSAAYLEESRGRDDLEILTEPRPMPLQADGNLPDSCLGPWD